MIARAMPAHVPANPTAAKSTPAAAKPTKVTRVVRAAPGEIRADSIYTLKEFCQRVGLGRWGVKELRLAGLKILRFHGRSFVAGKSFAEFLEDQSPTP